MEIKLDPRYGVDDPRVRADIMRQTNESHAHGSWDAHALRLKRQENRQRNADLIGFWSVVGLAVCVFLAVVFHLLGL